jgi:hypothetical protein
MAKALLGHVGNFPDARVIAEVHRLRAAVGRLEAENDHLRSRVADLQHDLDLAAELSSGLRLPDEMLTLDRAEPALT